MADPDPIGISEVAHRTGLQSSALRYYEKVGLITPVGRAGGRRQYDPSVFQRLSAIALLQEAGFTIAEVGQALGAGNDSWRTLAQQKLGELDAHMARIASPPESSWFPLCAATARGSTPASWSRPDGAGIAPWCRSLLNDRRTLAINISDSLTPQATTVR